MTVTTYEPATHGSALALSTEQDWWNDKQLAALRQMGLDKAGNGDLAVFMHVSQRTGLDPFAKQIYMIGRWSKDGTKYTIQTGIDGFRLIARRASDRLAETLEYEDTQWCDADGVWTDVWVKATAPTAARVTVLRHGKRFPAVALYREYVQTVKGGAPNSMWERMPANQLSKCAEALALRKAFPQDLSGIYADEEMGQAERPERRESASAGQASAADRMAQALGQEPEERPLSADQERFTDGERTLPADDIHDAEVVEPDLISPAQLKKLQTVLSNLGMERDDALAFYKSTTGRDVESSKALTADEASKVIDGLEALESGAES